ncbi:MAG: hypothetical protein LBV47_05500 [Bacteroidales bacterium]|jgi:hypothetical protein|nr:hypothetical protein [Bacteroidales bacterium]
MIRTNHFKLLTILRVVIVLLLCSCSNELTINMPKGPDGTPGASAYELWLQELAEGKIQDVCSGTPWDKQKNTMYDFFEFLRGCEGRDGDIPAIGPNGNWIIGGTDTGIPARGETGEPGKDGAPGRDGKSAYDLWKAKAETGTMDDPHNQGQKWPANEVGIDDFWRYLRGDDGKDGQPGGNTGQPGANIDTIAGVPNVIPRYVNQLNNEFVRWEDGGVGYTVFDDNSNPAVGAIVKGLPGVKDPNKEYTSVTGGFLLVPKEDLPDVKPLAERRGTAQVMYADESEWKESATTYVPNRIHVKLSLKVDPVIDGVYMIFSPIVERKTDGGDWQTIPNYLGELESQSIIAYEVAKSGPASYLPTTPYKVTYGTSHTQTGLNISSDNIQLNVNRLRKAATYLTDPADKWDGNEHYFTLVLDGYYGEQPQAPVVIQMPPVQAMPVITNLTAYVYVSDAVAKNFRVIDGEFDIGIDGAKIDKDLLFNNNFSKQTETVNDVEYACYSPVKDTPEVYNVAEQLTVSFVHTPNEAHNSPRGSMSSPAFRLTTPYLDARVALTCTGSYFYSLNSIGHFRITTPGNVPGDSNTLYIEDSNSYDAVFEDIPVTYNSVLPNP